MEITEVRIKLTEDSDDRLQAFCSITFDDCFVIRDLKIIEGANGPFVAMPSRKLTAHCPKCGCKNHLRAGFCNQCGLPVDHVLQQVQVFYQCLAAIDPAGLDEAPAQCRDLARGIIQFLVLNREAACGPGQAAL